METNGIIKKCSLCGVEIDGSDDYLHKSSLQHRFNFMLYEFHGFRKVIVKDKNGIVITAQLESRNSKIETASVIEKGIFNIKLTPEVFIKLNCTIRITFNIHNDGSKYNFVDVISNVLHPYEAFQLESGDKVNCLGRGANVNVCVIYQPNQCTVGSIRVPIGITVQPQTDPDKNFRIYREVIIHIHEGFETEDNSGKNPFQSENFNNIRECYEPTDSPKILNNYPIPSTLYKFFAYGLHSWKDISSLETRRLQDINKVLREPIFDGEGTYTRFYHYLLWLDEVCAVMMLKKYNMSNVTMTIVKGDWLELEVPGLAEKRPSIIVGDIISIRVHEDHTCYKGVVCAVNDKTIYIKNVHQELVYTISDQPDIELDVMYNLSRLQYERMHQGIEKILENKMMKTLFPVKQNRKITTSKIKDSEFYNPSIITNIEQRGAVESILSGTSQYAPYIVFGPPGTGKTITIVESILQIKTRFKNKIILVCAPSNAACDMLASKLAPHCSKDELLRLNSTTRDLDAIDKKLKRYSNIEGTDYLVLRSADLKKYRIVISTLHLIGKYVDGYSPDYVVIDEAAQATEPEADIAIGLMTPGKQVILAGDPKQLGPICASKLAEGKGLGTSLLERLMDTNQLYKPLTTVPLTYDSNFLTMLKNNYRSHPDILRISNELFYDNSLKPIRTNYDDPISSKFICPISYKSKKSKKNAVGNAVEFCSIIAKEERTGMSPSFYNQAEIHTVLKYIERLLSLQDCKVSQADIGIISPYIRQVQKIRMRLKNLQYTEIEVGTTESFQGQEKRIMIISTVRSQNSLLLYDQKYQLGFVGNERRFNVAITRAKAKVIVIGNPFCLSVDKKCWLNYIHLCEDLDSYEGAVFQERTEDVKEAIMSKLHTYSKH